MATVISFPPYLEQHELRDRIEWAEQEAGWHFNRATERQKAAFNLAMKVAKGCAGPSWDRKRTAARKAWAESTKEASALYHRTLEWFIAHNEMSDELDAEWTHLIGVNAVGAALSEAAE